MSMDQQEYLCANYLMLLSEQLVGFSVNDTWMEKCYRSDMTGHLGAEASPKY